MNTVCDCGGEWKYDGSLVIFGEDEYTRIVDVYFCADCGIERRVVCRPHSLNDTCEALDRAMQPIRARLAEATGGQHV